LWVHAHEHRARIGIVVLRRRFNDDLNVQGLPGKSFRMALSEESQPTRAELQPQLVVDEFDCERPGYLPYTDSYLIG
jgi:hypothetical protein